MTPRTHSGARGPRLLLRGWSLAVIATLPAALLHGVAHGITPSALAVVVAIVLAGAISVPLVGRKFTRLRSGAAILASQAIFHTFFASTDLSAVTAAGSAAANGAAASGVAASAGAAHAHHQHAPGSLELSILPGHNADAGMLAAHVVAAAITVGLVWYGEAVARRIARIGLDAARQLHALVVAVSTSEFLPQVARIPAVSVAVVPLASRARRLVQGRAPPAFA